MLVKLSREGGTISAHMIEDPFTPVADGVPLPEGAILVSLTRFLEEADALLARAVPLGVLLETADSPEKLGSAVHHLAVIELHVPYFRDGRAFSWARLLRTRLGYTGEIRITGHFLKDQMAFYARVGADAFVIVQNISLSEIQEAFFEMTNVYQPSVDHQPTIRQLRTTRPATISAS
jgi:uncharacterized protein (DUF934 family)